MLGSKLIHVSKRGPWCEWVNEYKPALSSILCELWYPTHCSSHAWGSVATWTKKVNPRMQFLFRAFYNFVFFNTDYINGLVQERRNSSVLTREYVFLALTHQYMIWKKTSKSTCPIDIFIRPFEKRDVLCRGNVRLSLRPSVPPSVRPRFPDFSSTCFEISIWNLVYTFSRWHDMSSLSCITIGSFWPSLQPKVGQTHFLQSWPHKSR